MAKRKTIMLLVTYGCNLRCTYCYEPKTSHRQMTLEQARHSVCKQVGRLDSGYDEFEVQLMGGEPLMVFPLMKSLSEWLWQQSWPLRLRQVFAPTNGTLLTDDMRQWLLEHRDKICLGLSFDGTRLMQNLNRSQSSASVDLAFFAQAWPKQSIKMTLSPATLPFLYDGVMFLYEQGLRYVTVDLAMGKTVVWEQRHLTVLAEQLRKLADYYMAHPEHPRVSLLDMDVTQVVHGRGSQKKCGCGEDLVCVDCDGKEYACHLFAPISASEELAQASQSIDFSNHDSFVDDNCRQCLLFPLCTSCYGMNYLLTGTVCKQSPFTCQAFRVQYLSACDLQLHLAMKNHDRQRQQEIEKIISQFH